MQVKRVTQVPERPDEAHFGIATRAAQNLGRLIDGNGLKADQLRLAKHDTIVHPVSAALVIHLKAEFTQGQMKGSHAFGETLGSKADVVSRVEGSIKDYLKSNTVLDEIEAGIAQDPYGGWGADTMRIPLKTSTRKEFSVVDKCLKCNGQIKAPCTRCNATGSTPCNGCQGQGSVTCPNCFGNGQVQNADGTRSPCTRCNGTMRIPCNTCLGQKMSPCTLCNQQGFVNCTECDASGFWTHTFQSYFVAEITFILDRDSLPEKVLAAIDAIGVRQLASEGFAEIFMLEGVLHERTAEIPLVAFFAMSDAEYKIEGRSYNAVVAGLNGTVLDIDTLLDPVIKPGINALLKLSKGPLASESLISTACKYRLIRDVIGGLAYGTKKQVYLKTLKQYPLVLSDKYARAAVKYADTALLALAHAPRNKGLLIGSTASAALSFSYYMAGIRPALVTTMQNALTGKQMLLADMAVWIIGYLAALFSIKYMAGSFLKRILPEDINKKEKGLPAAGSQGIMALGATFLIWIIAAALCPIKPDWIIGILKALHVPL